MVENPVTGLPPFKAACPPLRGEQSPSCVTVALAAFKIKESEMGPETIAIICWGMLGVTLCGSYMIGRFSRLPLWPTGLISASIPLLWYHSAVPAEHREQYMLIVGGWVIMGAVFLGAVNYAASRIGRSTKRRTDEYNRIRATY
jgi:hypothetical protein